MLQAIPTTQACLGLGRDLGFSGMVVGILQPHADAGGEGFIDAPVHGRTTETDLPSELGNRGAVGVAEEYPSAPHFAHGGRSRTGYALQRPPLLLSQGERRAFLPFSGTRSSDVR